MHVYSVYICMYIVHTYIHSNSLSAALNWLLVNTSTCPPPYTGRYACIYCVCVCACVFLCVYVCVGAHTHTCIHTHTHNTHTHICIYAYIGLLVNTSTCPPPSPIQDGTNVHSIHICMHIVYTYIVYACI